MAGQEQDDPVPETILAVPKPEHVGYKAHRTLFPGGDLERAFSYCWYERNAQDPLLLDKILNGTDGHDESQETIQRDARVAATIIQWLGTNIGLSFLARVFETAGCRFEYPASPDLPEGYRLFPE